MSGGDELLKPTPDMHGNVNVTDACMQPGMLVEYGGVTMTYEQMLALQEQEAKVQG